MFDIASIKESIEQVNLEEKIAKIKDLQSQSNEIRMQIEEIAKTLSWQQLLTAGLKIQAIIRHFHVTREDRKNWSMKQSKEFIEGHIFSNLDLYPYFHKEHEDRILLKRIRETDPRKLMTDPEN
jgi:hypothetical protein